MARTYKVTVTAGTHTWTVTDVSSPTYGLMDPLTISWSMPEDHRPTQPDTMVAVFGLVVPTAADVDDVVTGTLVSIAVTFGPTDKPTPDVVFYGRIAQGEASPHPRGMLYRFTCADLTADLSGYDLGAVAYPVQPVATRMATMLARAGIPDTAVVRDPVVAAVDANLYVEQIEQPAAANLLTSVIGLWDSVAMPGLGELAGVNHRAVLAPHPGAGAPTGIPYRWALDALPDKYVPSALAPLPASFGPWFPAPQSYGLYLDPDDRAAGVIDACVVEFDAAWAALQPSTVERAAVTYLYTQSFGLDPDGKPYDRGSAVEYTQETATPPDRPPTQTRRETQTISVEQALIPPTDPAHFSAVANAQRLGAMMIPAPQNPGGWAPDAFRWLLYKDPAGLEDFPVIFPHHDATDQPTPRVLRTACYVRPIVVTGIPGQWNAADPDRDWVGGQLNAVTLTIDQGRPVVDFELTPTLPEPGNPSTGTNAWNSQTGTWNAQAGTWNDKQPGRVAFRWSDSGLAGVTWNQLHPQAWDMYRLARGA